MSSIFTRIIDGELPGHFVWRDELCVSFLSINPLRPGHSMVVPRTEVDHWIDLDPELARHLMGVAQQIAIATQEAFSPVRVGLMIQGLEVPHVHIHLVPIEGPRDLDFTRAEIDPDPDALADSAERLRRALRSRGATGVSH